MIDCRDRVVHVANISGLLKNLEGEMMFVVGDKTYRDSLGEDPVLTNCISTSAAMTVLSGTVCASYVKQSIITSR